MRITGAGDITKPISETLEHKLPQSKISKTAAQGYSSYGNQIGLATTFVDEIYDDGYVAKRMEVGAVVGATYPEMGKVLRKIMPKTFMLVPGYGAQGGIGADLVQFFNEDGLGGIVNSSRGIIAAYKQEAYAEFGELNYADASRKAVEAMIADIDGALQNR